MEFIWDEIQHLKSDYPKISLSEDEYWFSLLGFKYFYNNGELDYADYENCFTDGKNDGGIDLITVDQKNGQDQIVCIQGKLISELKNLQDVVDIFTSMTQTIDDFKKDRTGAYNKNLRRIFREKIDSLEESQPNYSLVLLLGISPDEKKRLKISSEIAAIGGLEAYDCIVYYADDISSQIQKFKDLKPFVEEDKVQIAKEDGFIEYKDNGLLVNVSANSLKRLFDKYKDQGLFEQNFRYFIPNKKIDDRIIESLSHKRHNFWFLNNGIIIGCKDFTLDGDNVKLFDFSIINGCQTVTLIGKYSGPNQGDNFYLPCKIVKPSDHDDFESFISEIAEASNSQKPISERDLKSNRPEQKRLQSLLIKNDPKIYVQIKRGEVLVSAAKKSQLEKWQFTDNESFGQKILAFHLQKPGIARSGKKNIFTNNAIYDSIYKRPQNKESIIDTLKLFLYFKDWVNSQIIKDQFSNENHVSIGTNGTFVIPSIVGFMIKEKRGLLDTKKMNDDESEWEKEISKDTLFDKGLFVENLPDDFQTVLNDLFSDICYEVLALYDTRVKEEKTVSNFFKTDQKYRNIILVHIVNKYYRQQRKYNELKQSLRIFI